MNHMFMPLRRYADFNGRSRRKEFWLWQLLNFLVLMVLFGGFIIAMFSAINRVDQRGGVDWNQSRTSYETSFSADGFNSGYRTSSQADINPEMFMEEMGSTGWILLGLAMLWSLFAFLPNLAVTIRGLHDQDKSGWFVLLFLIPLVGPIILLIFYFIEGTRGSNRFGPDPKGPGVSQTFG